MQLAAMQLDWVTDAQLVVLPAAAACAACCLGGSSVSQVCVYDLSIGSGMAANHVSWGHCMLRLCVLFLQVFDSVSELVQSALDGYHVCLFSYGQTGAGKTYTMSGANTPEHQGLMPRAVNQVRGCLEFEDRSKCCVQLPLYAVPLHCSQQPSWFGNCVNACLLP